MTTTTPHPSGILRRERVGTTALTIAVIVAGILGLASCGSTRTPDIDVAVDAVTPSNISAAENETTDDIVDDRLKQAVDDTREDPEPDSQPPSDPTPSPTPATGPDTPVATTHNTSAGPADDSAATDELVSEAPADRPTPPAPPTGIRPVRIVAPAIGVDANVIDLDLRGAEPEVPEDFADVGWYVQTRQPGELGPAVLAGHVDSASGPAVFHRLRELQPGDEILIEGDDGERRTFVVHRSASYPKDELPPEVFQVEGSGSDLRLITCGGEFDYDWGHYRDNHVVYATAAGNS